MANKPQISPAMADTPAKFNPNHLGALLILLVGLVGLILIIQLERAHRTLQDKVLQQTEQRGLQLAETIGGQIDGLISSVDLSLLQLRREWLRNETQWLRSPSDYDADVQRALSALPQGMATHLSIADASGLIVYNSLEVGRETRVDDRPHFRIHLSGEDRLAIGNPVQSRLFDGEWTFIVNRPLLRDGRFAGTINMSVSSRHIAERLGALRLSSEDTVTLVAGDGTFLARSLNFQTAMGQRLPSDRPFLLENADINGIFLLPGQVDGIERIYAWHRIDPYGLFVIVGLSTAAVMEPLTPAFRRDHYMTAALIALLAAFGAISLFLLKRIIRQQREVDRNAAFRRSVFDSSPVPVMVADASTLQFVDCNPAAVIALGLTNARDVLGTTLLDHSAEFQTDGIVSSRLFPRSIASTKGGRATRFEWRQRRPNGEHWDAEIHVLPFQADGHALLQFTLRDISEQKRAQDAMATSEERLRQAMRISRLGLFDHDHVRDSIYWSPELRKIYGVARDAPFTLGDLASLIHPDDVELMLNAIHKAHDPSGDGTFDVSYRIRRHDGQTLWLSSRAQTYFRGEGAQRRPFRTVGAVLDFTEQRAAEEALRRTNTVLAAVRHSQSQFMAKRSAQEIFNDLLKAILDITESAYGFIGELHRDEADKPYLKAHGITNIAWNEETRRFYAENAPSGLDFRNLDNLFGRAVTEREVIIANDPASDPRSRGVPRGHPAVEAFMAVPFFENNELLGIIALANRPGGYDESLLPILEPVTTALRNLIVSLRSERQRLQAEQALQTLNADLENRVEQRTADFRRAMEEAERANAAKSEFLSRMSHELRTPLNAILGFGQLLETDPQEPLTEAQKCNVSEILHAGHHLLDMINEVLDLARIESGRIDVSMEPVAVSEVVHSCAAQIRPLIEQRGLSLSIDTADAWVIADRTRLKQILLNLLSNAVKYNHDNGHVAIKSRLIGEDRIRISISDTGQGIDPDQRDRLFHPFERLESAYQGIEGTGIGLALSKRLTEAMNGVIGVDSTLAKGSTFWVEFPACPSDLMPTEGEAQPIVSSHAQPVALAVPQPTADQRRRLLYIEDNPANMKLVRKAIGSKSNLALIEATTAEEGIVIADRDQPDVILLDINLPGISGYEALKVLRANPRLCNTRIIGLSANAMQSDIERARMAGFSDYLTKPIDISALLNALEAHTP